MPRPYPPLLLRKPTVDTFVLDSVDQQGLARTLGLPRLPPKVAAEIGYAIACYKVTQDGSRDTTKGNTLAALDELIRRGRSYMKAVSRFASDLSGVDDTTLSRLQPLARAVLGGDLRARETLAQAARARAAEVRNHPHVVPKAEVLRFFCGVLRVIFDAAASPTVDRTWHNCGLFVLEVLSTAGIEHANFHAHPGRLRKYLATDVTTE
jgi:hypothetical protein